MSSSVKLKILLFVIYIVLRNINAEKKLLLQYNVTCDNDLLMVEMEKPKYESKIYIEKLMSFPGIGCDPQITKNKALFRIPLKSDGGRCGTIMITDLTTGEIELRNKIIVKDMKNESDSEEYIFQCVYNKKTKHHNVTKRNVLPAGFREQDDIELTTTLQTNAPKPVLNVAVKQGNSLINGELNVKPGTPLTMEIYLDKESAPIYGLLVSFMRVSDTKSQEETIIFNGCSLDPYLFENFNTIDGDTLSAKFRAFKFPETTYVQFTGTVSVCLDKCTGIECSNGQTGYGRRKREISSIPYDPKKIFEVTLTTYIKVEKSLDKENPERIFKEKQYSKNYKVLDFNESHVVPLEDLFEIVGSKKQDNSNGTTTYYRESKEDSSYSTNLKPCLLSFLLTLKTIFYFFK